MKIISSIEEMQQTSLALRREGKRIGFVPTMGYLHEGHLSLMRIAREQAEVVVASIFVNPTQFGPNEDLEAYPRDFDRDEKLCRETGVDLLFCPSAEAMYPEGSSVRVSESVLSKALCGRSRPTHFEGVLTVVAKLFNLVLPDFAVFGRKDAQQLRLLEQMTADLNFPVEIVSGPIVREEDGVAMSSRNAYLSDRERRDATALHRSLQRVEALYQAGERDEQTLREAVEVELKAATSGRIDYVEIVDALTLEQVHTLTGPTLVALAVFFGRARLIDNVTLG